jgi:hypothetical protein
MTIKMNEGCKSVLHLPEYNVRFIFHIQVLPDKIFSLTALALFYL